MFDSHSFETEMKKSNPTSVTKRNRGERPVNSPEHLEDYYLYNSQEIHQCVENNPVTVKEALQSPKTVMWKKAMIEEIKYLNQAQTWEFTTRLPGVKTLLYKWLFRKKKDEKGKPLKFTARLVAKGYFQVSGVDFQDTFLPIIKLKSIRLLLAIVAEKDFEVHQME